MFPNGNVSGFFIKFYWFYFFLEMKIMSPDN